MSAQPLGIRSNNPGNLRPSAARWSGELEPDPRGYCRFDAPENGIRAMAKNLIAYQEKHRLRTVQRIVSRWAPGAENDTEAYIVSVCKRTGFGRDQVLDLRDRDTLRALVLAIVWHENGAQPYDGAVIDEGLRRALE